MTVSVNSKLKSRFMNLAFIGKERNTNEVYSHERSCQTVEIRDCGTGAAAGWLERLRPAGRDGRQPVLGPFGYGRYRSRPAGPGFDPLSTGHAAYLCPS